MAHNVNYAVEPELFSFPSWGAFDYWRLNIIVDDKSISYVSASTTIDPVTEKKTCHLFNCHRSGNSKSVNPGASLKLGYICPSQLVS